jgi:hypothetical protein
MSRKFQKQYATDVYLEETIGRQILAGSTTVPGDGGAGWLPGALYIDTDGSGVNTVYRNEGSVTSCSFKRLLSVTDVGGIDLTGLTATATELNTLHGQTLAVEAGAGITGGASTVYKSSVQKSGGIFYTTILLDMTSLQSSTTDLDIIGQSTTPAHLGQITAARNGTILYGRLTCIEVPVTGVTDIDLYSATEATGKFDDAVTGLTETALITNGGAWTLNLVKHLQDVPVADQYLYLTCGAAGTVGTYSAGKFLLELFGY